MAIGYQAGRGGVSLNRQSKILAKTAPQQAKDGAQGWGPNNMRFSLEALVRREAWSECFLQKRHSWATD